MSDGGEAREETRGHLDLIRAEAAGERRALEVPVSWRSRIPASTVLAVALGAAALGGLGALVYPAPAAISTSCLTRGSRTCATASTSW